MPFVLFILLGSALLPARAFAQAEQPSGIEPVRQAAEAYLHAAYPQDAHRLRVRILRTSDGLPAEGGVKIVLPRSASVPRAHTQVDVFTAAGEKAGWALLYVAHFDSVVVSGTRLSKDAEVSPTDVTVAWMETTTFHGTPMLARDLRTLRQQGSVFAARLIRDGQALRASDVRPAYAADTGDLVLLNYNRGPISLRLSCKAREPGAVGDTIRLYAPDTETTYRARLTAPGVAEWIETL